MTPRTVKRGGASGPGPNRTPVIVVQDPVPVVEIKKVKVEEVVIVEEKDREPKVEAKSKGKELIGLKNAGPQDTNDAIRTIQEFSNLMRSYGLVLPSGAGAPAAAPLNNPEDKQPMALQYFEQLNPPKFTGTGETKEAEDWIMEVKKQLEVVGTPVEYQVLFATYLFQGEAKRWWYMEKTRRDVNALSWEEFENIFNSNYISTAYKRKRVQEFALLKQDSLTVSQYAARFIELSRYAPHLVVDESMRAEWFQDGLKPSIRSKLVAFKLSTYNQVVEMALLVEADFDQCYYDRESKQEILNQGSSNLTGNHSSSRGSRHKDNRHKDYRVAPYQKQNGQFSGQQKVGQSSAGRGSGEQRLCFWCKELGHIKPNCPWFMASRGNVSQLQQPQNQGGQVQGNQIQ